jgi:dihydroneopterin aldolase
MIVELYGLEVFGRHGVLASEQRDGQTFLFDVTLEVDEPHADRVEEAVDYREVAAKIQEISDTSRFNLLETVAVAVAEALVESFPVASATVRVRKTRPTGIASEWSAATAARSRSR